MMMTVLKHVRDWRLLVGEVEAGVRRRGENVLRRVLGLEQSDVHDRLRWRKGIMGKPSDPCKHGNNRRLTVDIYFMLDIVICNTYQ